MLPEELQLKYEAISVPQDTFCPVKDTSNKKFNMPFVDHQRTCRKFIIHPCLKFKDRFITKLPFNYAIGFLIRQLRELLKYFEIDPQLIRNLLSSCLLQENEAVVAKWSRYRIVAGKSRVRAHYD
ncbi:hypothetical protein TNCV_2594701 [Trichonephila clavipes]|nr:hypothetical protein TNCV_2594701 [Trichonephila clavipes]